MHTFETRLTVDAERDALLAALAGAQGRDFAWGLGSNRRQWGAKFQRWFELQVEAASRLKEQQPAPASSPAG